jgi:penicillin-binding protein 2
VATAETVAAESAATFASLGIADKHFALVRDGMYGVVNEEHGTAFHARIEDKAMAMAGKTGTAQVRHITEAEREHGLRKITDVPWKERDHALFIAFAPAAQPRYVCAVVVEHGGVSAGEGGAVAAPIARDLLLAAQQRDPAQRIPAEPFGATAKLAQG